MIGIRSKRQVLFYSNIRLHARIQNLPFRQTKTIIVFIKFNPERCFCVFQAEHNIVVDFMAMDLIFSLVQESTILFQEVMFLVFEDQRFNRIS